LISYSELRKSKRIPLADAVPLDKPMTVYVEPTNRCNLSCSFCPQSLDDYKERAGYWEHMEIELYRKVISEIKAMEIKSLKLYFFGEPLLHPEIGEILRLATGACDRVELTTNGMPMTAKRVQEIVDAEVDYMRVSIYDHIAHPENVVRNVRLLWEARQARGASKPFIFVKVFDQAQADSVRADYEGICDEIGCEELHSIGSDMIQIKRLTGTQVACPYPFYNLVVKSNGDVVPCCVAWEKSLVVGNAKEQTLSEIWRGDASFRQRSGACGLLQMRHALQLPGFGRFPHRGGVRAQKSEPLNPPNIFSGIRSKS
jgi:MoaA/NifB/PqqE/SkfB family radical SAM enzyme